MKLPIKFGVALTIICLLLIASCTESSNTSQEVTEGFPWDRPATKPDRPLSEAMNRMFQEYRAPRPEDNELFSSFAYTRLEGFDYHNGSPMPPAPTYRTLFLETVTAGELPGGWHTSPT